MTRTVAEWIGKTDDSTPPPRVRLRVWERCGGRCHKCSRKILTGEKWVLEHLQALINGGENREGNLGLTCCNCLPGKNAADVAQKSKTATIRKKHLGIRKPKSRPMPGSRASGLRKRMNGRVEKWG